MFHRWAALVLVLALCAISPKNAAGQSTQSPRGTGARGRIGGNYPNPFNPDTRINFSVGENGCVPGTESHVVSIQIMNVLAQVVAIPVFYGTSQTATSGAGSSVAGGQPIRNLTMSCGNYVAYWKPTTPDGHEAASGVYGVLLYVDGKLEASYKIFYKK